ncbi:type II secretion system protein [bacterium]|nr:type II secretion system protein [candidate division CSSED10-310 bacterium]
MNRIRWISPRSCGGFTLLEVMVAIAILGLTLTGIMVVFSNSLQGIGKTELYTEGVLVAREAIERMMILPDMQEGFSSGVYNDMFRWEVQIIKRDTAVEAEKNELIDSIGPSLPLSWLEEESPLSLYEIIVDVTWPGTGYPGHVTLRTLQARVEIPELLMEAQE